MVCSLSGCNRKETMYALHLIGYGYLGTSCYIIWFYHTDSLGLTPSSVILLLLVAGLCCGIWYSLKELIDANYQSIQLKTQKETLLSYLVLLDTLLPMETEIPQAESAIVLHNEKQTDRKIQIIVNPHCKHCARHYKEWLRLDISVNLLFLSPIGTDRTRKLRWQLFPVTSVTASGKPWICLENGLTGTMPN